MTVARWTLPAVFASLFAIPAAAEPRAALIVAATGSGESASGIRREAQDLSESLFGMGFTVTRLENPTAAQIATVAAGMPRNGAALLSFIGPAVVEAEATQLMVGAEKVPLDATIAAMQRGRTGPTLVLLDTCHGGGAALPAPVPLANTFVALPNPPGVDCVADAPSLTLQFLEKTAVPGVPLTEAMPATAVTAEAAPPAPGVWVQSSLTAPFTLRVVQNGTQLSAADYRMLERLPEAEREKLLALWQDAGIAVDIDRPAGRSVTGVVQDGVILASPVQPVVQTASILTPVANVISPVVSGSEVQGEQLAIFTASPVRTGGARPVPGAGGLPRPSVILGEAPTLAALETPVPDVPPAQILDYTDLAARTALKTADRAEYDRLILAGSYNPPPEQLAVAVQTELARMGCYRSGIDGQWGPGSRRALQLYFDTLKVAATTQEPTVEVFQLLLQKDEVECPVPVAAPATTRNTATRTNTQRTQTQAAAPRQQPRAVPAAPAPAAPARRIGTSTGSGVYR